MRWDKIYYSNCTECIPAVWGIAWFALLGISMLWIAGSARIATGNPEQRAIFLQCLLILSPLTFPSALSVPAGSRILKDTPQALYSFSSPLAFPITEFLGCCSTSCWYTQSKIQTIFSCGTDIHSCSTRHATDYRRIIYWQQLNKVFLYRTPDLEHYTISN